MAYEKLKLLVAAVSGEIYLTKVLKSGLMSDTRRKITSGVMAAVANYVQVNHSDTNSFTWHFPEDGYQMKVSLEKVEE